MTTLQRLNLRKSEMIRRNQRPTVNFENPTEEQRSKLTTLRTEHREVQTKYQAALKTAPGPEQTGIHRIENGAQTEEQRAFVALEDAVHPADYLGEVQGQAAEYRTELGMTKGIPHMSLLDPVERVELRVDVVSTGSTSPRVTSGRSSGQVVGRQHSLVYGGVFKLSVEPGTAAFPVVTAAAATGVADRSVAVESTAVTLVSEQFDSGSSPVSGESWEVESEYAMPEFRAALQQELRRALREEVDKLAIQGKASAHPQWMVSCGLSTNPTDPQEVGAMADLIDVFVPSPPWSSTPAEPRLACNRDVIRYFMSLSDATSNSGLGPGYFVPFGCRI